MEQRTLFPIERLSITKASVSSPQGYKGFASLHKYWGKKPVECLAYLIEQLTQEGEIVVDPFLGYGTIAREALIRKRRFIGMDINPISVELTKNLITPSSYDELFAAFALIEREVKPKIDESYQLADGRIATHFLWNDSQLESVWVKTSTAQKREELKPTDYDLEKSEKYRNYRAQQMRSLRFFRNSRINASPNLTSEDLFTGRALRNIDLLLEHIRAQSHRVRRAMLLTLTAASGQMSKMVFAVSGRGKNGGKKSDKGISVGSWVIGFWRPKRHFEINVWNCFFIRARKLLKALREAPFLTRFTDSADPMDVINSFAEVSLINDDCREVLARLPKKSVSLLLTDPPHSDRIPYLELSEFWNAILGFEPFFEKEIVVSNALERGKGKTTYTKEMHVFFLEAIRVLSDWGIMAIIFNACDHQSWENLRSVSENSSDVVFRGCFPMSYSAKSVVQDNRVGSLKHDYVLIYQKIGGQRDIGDSWRKLEAIHSWSSSFPKSKD